MCVCVCVTGVAHLAERLTLDPKTRCSNPVCVRSTRKMCVRVFPSKKKAVLTRCRCAQPPVCTRIHTNDHVRTLKKVRSCSPCQTTEFDGLRKHEKSHCTQEKTHTKKLVGSVVLWLLAWKEARISRELHWDKKSYLM